MKLLIDSDMAKMPRNCHECPLGMGSICFWMPSDVDEDRPQEGKPDWCPLSECDYPGPRKSVYEKPLREIIATMQEEVDEWRHYTDSELAQGVTVDCDFYLAILLALKARPTKFDIKTTISNVDIPKDVDEEQFFAVLSAQYAALAKLYGDDVPTYSPS